MSVNPTNVSQAYLDTARSAKAGGLGARDSKTGDFSALLDQVATSSIDAARAGEVASIKGLAGTADVADVVTAVTNAELALQTVITVRDRVIQAYQDIIRMPI